VDSTLFSVAELRKPWFPRWKIENFFIQIMMDKITPSQKLNQNPNKMSSQPVETVTAVITEKKPRPPTLPAKFGKFIQFGFYFMKTFNQDAAAANEAPLDEAKFLEVLRLRGTVDEQKDFVQTFFDDSKEIAKEIRKLVKAKPVKAKRAKKEPAEDGADPAPKKKRGKKAIVTNGQSDLVAEIVALANGGGEPTVPSDSTASNKVEADARPPTPSPPSLVAEKVVEKPKKGGKTKAVEVKETAPVVSEAEAVAAPAAKKGRKPKAVEVKETAPVVSEGEAVAAPAAKKGRKPKSKETASVPPTVVVEEQREGGAGVGGRASASTLFDAVESEGTVGSPAPDEEDLPVNLFLFDGVQFLIDDLHNVYDFHSQELVGSFDPLSHSIRTIV